MGGSCWSRFGSIVFVKKIAVLVCARKDVIRFDL